MKSNSRVPREILKAEAGVQDACNQLITKASEIANESEHPMNPGALVEKAFRTLSFKTHPDRNPNDEKAKSNFQNLGNAKDLLMKHRAYLAAELGDPNAKDATLRHGLINEIFSELQKSKISIDRDSKIKTQEAIKPVLEELPLEFLRDGKKSISQQIQATAKSVSDGGHEVGDRWLEIRKKSLRDMAKQYEASQDKSNFFAQAPEPKPSQAETRSTEPPKPSQAETRSTEPPKPAQAETRSTEPAVSANPSKTKKSSDKKSFPGSFIQTIRNVLHRPPTGVKPGATPRSKISQSNWLG